MRWTKERVRSGGRVADVGEDVEEIILGVGGNGGQRVGLTALCQMSTTFLCRMFIRACWMLITSACDFEAVLLTPSCHKPCPGSRHAKKRSAIKSRFATAQSHALSCSAR